MEIFQGKILYPGRGTVTIRPNQYAIYEYTWNQRNVQGVQVTPGEFVLDAFNVARVMLTNLLALILKLGGVLHLHRLQLPGLRFRQGQLPVQGKTY
ncbi:hypothetical protein N752_05405 [Desulforamulus aquiferis]|nr:hypothetical protein N752_05405 [Desulforamulus aquiferis]